MERIMGPFGRRVVVPTRAGTEPDRPTLGQVRGPGWRRTSRGFYVPAGTPRTPEQRIAEASVVVPDRAGITGWAALRWMGGRWFDGTERGSRAEVPVSIATGGSGARVRRQAGIEVCAERLGPDDLLVHDGLRVTTAARATSFAMRRARSLVESVVVIDMSGFSNLTSITETADQLAQESGLTGIAQARAALALAHENSWSPMETRLRMMCRLSAEFPPPLVNRAIFDLDERHLGTPDLLDLEAGLVIEYDGAAFHQGPRRLGDNDREDVLRDAGLSYVTVLGDEFHDEERLVDRLRRARARALTERGARRERWTIEAPPSWLLLDTVARRRAAHSQRRFSPPVGRGTAETSLAVSR